MFACQSVSTTGRSRRGPENIMILGAAATSGIVMIRTMTIRDIVNRRGSSELISAPRADYATLAGSIKQPRRPSSVSRCWHTFRRTPSGGSCGNLWNGLEDEPRDGRLQIPIDDRNRGEIEGGVRDHQHEEPARDRIDRSEDQSEDGRLLDARDSLIDVVREAEYDRCDQDDRGFGCGARSE